MYSWPKLHLFAGHIVQPSPGCWQPHCTAQMRLHMHGCLRLPARLSSSRFWQALLLPRRHIPAPIRYTQVLDAIALKHLAHAHSALSPACARTSFQRLIMH